MRIFTVFMAAGLLGVLAPAAAQVADLSIESNTAFLAANAKKPGVYRRASGLEYKIVQSGYGRRPLASDTVTLYYTGTLLNGTLFDGTSPGLPVYMKVSKFVPGFQEALQLMREGDHWTVWIPANLAYGAKGTGDGLVPPNQTLVFDLRLVAAKPAPRPGDPDYVPDPSDPDAARQGAQ